MTRVPALNNRAADAKWRVVWGAGQSKRFRGREFFEEECDADQRDALLATMRLLEESDDGRIANDQQFKYPLKGQKNIGEFKVFKKRLYFFRDKQDFVITNGATKMRQETDRGDFDRLRRIQKEMQQIESKAA